MYRRNGRHNPAIALGIALLAAALVRPAATGAVLVVLAAVVALASLDATGSLLALAVGAVVASAGVGASRLRLTRR